MTRLYEAAKKGDLELVNSYLKDGDNPNQIDSEQRNPLHAITFDNPIIHHTENETRIQIVKALLQAGVDVNQKDKLDRVPLYYAAFIHDDDLVAILLENGAKTDIADCLGDTPLHVAAQLRIGGDVDYAKTIELLLKAGADLDTSNAIGFTPRSDILFSGRNDLQHLVEKYGSNEAPKLSDNEQGLAKLLVKFSGLLKVDEKQATKLKSLLPDNNISSSDSENNDMPELIDSDEETRNLFHN